MPFVDASPFIPVAAAAQLHASLPDAELHVIGHAKHGMSFSHGRECAGILRRFLDRRFCRPEPLRKPDP